MQQPSHAGAHVEGFFSSRRERRLWLWTGAVVAAIYATLGLARTMADVVGNEDMLGATFGLGFLLVLLTIAWFGLTKRAGRCEIGIALGVVATYLLLFVRMGTAAERTHLVEYGVVAVFIFEALTERLDNGRHVPVPWLVAIVLAAFLGCVDEGIQAILPTRVFDPVDIVTNVGAATLAVGASVTLRWARARGR